MGTLYECLREARLEQFYPAFRANGITRSEALINLGMPEFCALGITGSEDKRRLMELVNIIKEVHSSGLSASPTSQRRGGQRQAQPNTSGPDSTAHGQTHSPDGSRGSAHARHRARQDGTGRQLQQGQLEAASATDPRHETGHDSSGRDRVPNFSAASYLDMLQFVSDSSGSEGVEADSSDEETLQPVAQSAAPQRSVASSSAVRSSVSRPAGVERIKTKGYNYGVHKVSTPTKSKSSRPGFNRGLRDDKIKVCVRKRPLTRREVRAKDEDVVAVESTTTLIVNEPKLAVDLKAYTLQHEFIFDEVFHESCSNEDVYTRAARPLISCIFNGGTATCFAYGQTGAGKTHTMLGNTETPGLYLLAGRDIFSIIQSGQYGRGLHVWISFFEIYCGQLFDLLNRRNRLHAREDGSRQVCIAGLTETEATSVNSLVQTLEYGNSVRSKGATGVNPDSSRSHAILQLDIRNSEDIKVGKISFIDLAGSERASDVTDTDKQTRMEGAEINQSLLALKECIRSIDQDSRHTPFRQSKLTHILKDSFVGNSRTCMIANISPTQSACENTLNTLRYADRVKELKRDSTRSSTVGQAMNLLMNIPPTAPTIFHPSNILSSSTPMRPQTQARRGHQAERPNETSDVTLDLSDTPIRGHNLPRRTRESLRAQQQPGPRPGNDRSGDAVSPPPQVVQTSLGSRSTVHAADGASQGAAAPPPDASPSESDHTDTDSCNVTHPTFKLGAGLAERRMPMVGSMDTEFDFPTSDFNNPEEFNDLNHPQHQEDTTRPERGEGRALPEQGHGSVAASGAEMATASPTAGAKFPQLKPIVYRSRDQETEVVAAPSSAQAARQRFQESVVSSPKVSQHTPKFNRKPLCKELFSSDESPDEEELLQTPDPQSNAPHALNNLAAPPPSQQNPPASSVQHPNRANFMNKGLMLPQPAVSSDLTKFTQRPSLRPTDYEPPVSTNNLSPKPGGAQIQQSSQATDAIQLTAAGTNKPPVLRLRELPAAARARSPGQKSPKGQESKQGSEQNQALNNKQSLEEWRSSRPQQTKKSPSSLEHTPHPPASPPPGRHPSPPVVDRAKAAPASDVSEAASRSEFREETPSGSRRHSDIAEPKAHHRAASSPTGEKSDDSTESIRASMSDQGQGGYRRAGYRDSDRASMRKERSDPLLALNMQRKKQTLPDPQSFSKMLTRGNTPKSGLPHREVGGGGGGSWKVIHDQIPSSKSGSSKTTTTSVADIMATDLGDRPAGSGDGSCHSEPSSLAHVGTGEAGSENLHQDNLLHPEQQDQHFSDGGGGGWVRRARLRGKPRAGLDCTSPDSAQPDSDDMQYLTTQASVLDNQGHTAHYLDHHSTHTITQDPHIHTAYSNIAKNPSHSTPQVSADVPLHPPVSRAEGLVQLPPSRPEVMGQLHTADNEPLNPECAAGLMYRQEDNTNSGSCFRVSASATGDLPTKNTALVTEKLAPGAMFSPIHPYPVTVAGTRVVTQPATVSALPVQPTPVPVNSGSSLATGLSMQEEAMHMARSDLISAHEDQLASITALCRHEMKLLLNAKKAPGRRGFDDYLRRVSDILQQKMAAITSLQDHISTYRTDHPATSTSISSRSVASSVSVSLSDGGSSVLASHSRFQ